MTELIHIGNRGRQILKTLLENGPLSSSTLREVIEPPMTVRRMNAAIRRLRDIGLVKNRHSSISHCAGRFIELASGQGHRRVLSKVLDVPVEAFEQIPGGTEALEHWQECTVWAKYLRTQYPEGKVIRDFEIARDEPSLNALIVDKEDIDLLPDLILRLPLHNSRKSLNVGIEIERSQKSKYRIAQKLRKFSTRTRLDTVLYICSRPHVAENLVRVYVNKVQPKVTRIRHYSENFLLISKNSTKEQTRHLSAKNVNGAAIDFPAWIHFLRTHEMSERGKYCGAPRASPGS